MSLLPANATTFERAQSAVSARILDIDADTIRRQRRADQCSARFLPLLAWERSVHFWLGDPARIADDRAAVASSFNDHLNYGSPSALEAEIALDVGAPVRVLDFWHAGVDWPKFVVEVSASANVRPSALMASALRRKNVRDWPIIRLRADSGAGMTIAAAISLGQTIRIRPADPTVKFAAQASAAAAIRLIATIRVRPYK